MKFFLARGVSIDVPIRTTQDRNLGIRRLRAEVKLKNIVPQKGSEEIAELCNELCQRLNLLPNRHGSLKFEMVAGIDDQGVQNVCLRIPSGPLLAAALIELFGEDVTLQMAISNLYIDGVGAIGNVTSSEMKVRNYGDYSCEDSGFSTSATMLEVLNDHDLRGELTLTVSVSDAGPELATTDKLQAYKKMLLEGIRADVVIIPESGVRVNAHTAVLAAHSPVFRAMFENDMQEAKTHTVEMKDMSEEGVHALLASLYYWEEPKSKAMVAFEVLCAGHKYDIPVLEADMKNFLLRKPDKWYEVDVALKLFLFAKNLPTDGERLKMKAIRVLKIKSADLSESPTCVALFEEDPDAALELSQCLAA